MISMHDQLLRERMMFTILPGSTGLRAWRQVLFEAGAGFYQRLPFHLVKAVYGMVPYPKDTLYITRMQNGRRAEGVLQSIPASFTSVRRRKTYPL